MKTFSVKKQLPLFLSEKEKVRFEASPEIHFIHPSMQIVNNAWLTHSGICFKPSRLFKESVYWMAYPAVKFYLQAIYNLLRKNPRFYAGVYVYMHTPWSVVNYYHWIADSLPRLYPLASSAENLVLLLPEKVRNVHFIQDSLKVFGIQKIVYINEKEVNKVEKLILVEITPGNYRLSSDLKPMIQLIKEKLGISSVTPFRRIFLTRRNVRYRTLENEHEVSLLLEKHGFEILEADTLSFSEQVQLFSETQFVVAVHGAALTNCIFMQAGTSVLELHPAIENKEKIFHESYWNVSQYFDLNYYFLGCEPVNPNERFHTANLKVEVNKLEKILETWNADD